MSEYARLNRREEQKRRRRRRRAAGLFSALALLVASGYAATHALNRDAKPSRTRQANRNGAQERSPTTTTVGTRTRRTRTGRTRPAQTGLLTAAARGSFRRLEKDLGGSSGLAVSSVGLDPLVHEVGALREGVAWSTIKVPIAMAVEIRAKGHPTATEQSLLSRAITASDNSAAEALWSGLGPPSAAAAAVHGVLASAGDASTEVEGRVLRPGFTSFGQTQWSLAAQQRFIAALPCLNNSKPVLSLMQQIQPDQRWGLGSLGVDAQFKGGWGPDPGGQYLVRQMGIVRLSNGRSLAVSMATMPATGTFEGGIANLNQIARWLLDHVDSTQVSATQCR